MRRFFFFFFGGGGGGCVLGHVGIRGNSAADTAAKGALDGDISDELIPFSDLKPPYEPMYHRILATRVGYMP